MAQEMRDIYSSQHSGSQTEPQLQWSNCGAELLDALRLSGPEVDAQRRALLKGRRVLFVMGAYPGKRAMYERARELGVRMVVLDGPGHWTQSAPELFEQFIEVDLADATTLLPRALEAIEATRLQFDAVATFWELAGLLAAQIANQLGLPGHSLAAIATSRDKVFARMSCRNAGIATPRFARICSPADIQTAASEVGFPAVLKPISGVSSNSVYKVQSLPELQARYAQVLDEAEVGREASGVHSDHMTALVWSHGREMVLEEYLDGEEFDVDCLLSGGELVYANLVRDLPQPYMVEIGSQMPPNYPQERQAELVILAQQSLATMGFHDGAFHVEMKYTSQGPRLIEVNARIGGGPVWGLHRQVWGVDLVEQYLMIQLGIPIRPVPAPEPQVYLITSDLPAPYTGIVTGANFLDHLVGKPHIVAAYPKIQPGQRVIGPDTGVPESVGEITVQGESIGQAEQIMAELLSILDLPITPEQPCQTSKDEGGGWYCTGHKHRLANLPSAFSVLDMLQNERAGLTERCTVPTLGQLHCCI